MNEHWRILMLLDVLHFIFWSRIIDDCLTEPYMVEFSMLISLKEHFPIYWIYPSEFTRACGFTFTLPLPKYVIGWKPFSRWMDWLRKFDFLAFIYSYGVTSKKMFILWKWKVVTTWSVCVPVAVTNIRGWPGQLVHVSDSIEIAVKQCMQAGGGNFEHFLWRNNRTVVLVPHYTDICIICNIIFKLKKTKYFGMFAFCSV